MTFRRQAITRTGAGGKSAVDSYKMLEKYSSVSSMIERVKRQMKEDAGFRKRIDELSSTLTKSQGQT